MELLIFSYKCLCEIPSLFKFLSSVVLTRLAFKELHYREFEVVYGHLNTKVTLCTYFFCSAFSLF